MKDWLQRQAALRPSDFNTGSGQGGGISETHLLGSATAPPLGMRQGRKRKENSNPGNRKIYLKQLSHLTLFVRSLNRLPMHPATSDISNYSISTKHAAKTKSISDSSWTR
jgi:hypothetical protein